MNLNLMKLHRQAAFRWAITIAATFGLTLNTPANPTGLTVASGSVTIHQSGSQFTITASQNAFLNWKSF